jgi:prepilin-type processing-associated H-X9-DG protein
LNLAEGAISPIRNISYAFNMRLRNAGVKNEENWSLADVILTPRVLDYPLVPLVFDVDGARAGLKGHSPFYTAPALGDHPVYAEGGRWFPSMRHDGKLQAAFIGGHVASSADPAYEPGWDWRYEPPPLD